MSENNIGAKGCQSLCKVLKDNTNLKSLDLSGKLITTWELNDRRVNSVGVDLFSGEDFSNLATVRIELAKLYSNSAQYPQSRVEICSKTVISDMYQRKQFKLQSPQI